MIFFYFFFFSFLFFFFLLFFILHCCNVLFHVLSFLKKISKMKKMWCFLLILFYILVTIQVLYHPNERRTFSCWPCYIRYALLIIDNFPIEFAVVIDTILATNNPSRFTKNPWEKKIQKLIITIDDKIRFAKVKRREFATEKLQN